MRVGSRGTVVIPKKIREEYGLREGDVLQIFLKRGNIVLVRDDVWDKLHGCARGLVTAGEVEKEIDEDEIAWEKRLRE